MSRFAVDLTSTSIPQSNVVELNLRNADRAVAIRVLNALIAHYLTYRSSIFEKGQPGGENVQRDEFADRLRKAEDDLAQRPSHHVAEPDHDHDDFDSFVVALDPVAEPEALLRVLAGVAERHDVLRMKGFVAVSGKPMRLLVQGVGARFEKSFDRPWAAGEARRGRLVVIGEKGLDAAAIEREISGEAMAA